ncbi:phospholipid carrier-dependent glycosyltransferase [Komarekiella sp. 'clone 1']|uniref:Phospholipid carrier-dependent glycosyltransferase n=1 Tax=Komarekiella delphini-convector SJRDD-AB1 TaxID=2593771 RepID=A0AA40SYZ4_9NOST|nr:glycosyltransferase family 39 protein [Komarekiella delphini-convector]MBD6617560.1 phospholipid carrier-dependent glycosyltransferase [Komarekiella delphini-convector SJRDD-AB1]
MKNRSHLLLLLLWLAIGTGLRFLRLASLPPWTDECATLVFSLGNSFHTVPLNQIISSDVLLQPLQPIPVAGISAVIEHLFNESNHPPIYFVLAHFWMKMFSPTGELASIWVARSLSALFGVASIPAMFGFGYLAFRSKLVGQMAAAMMAVSPYTVFLAREARHYTLAILLVIASLCCFVKAIQTIHRRQSLSIWIVLAWVAINSLGVATHFFFTLTLCAEGFVLLRQIWLKMQQSNPMQPNWWRIWIVAMGTFIGCLVWVPTLQNIPGSDLTNWVAGSNAQVRWLEPIGRLLLWIISMLLLLPSALTNLSVVIVVVSGVVTLLFLFWSLPNLTHGFKIQQQHPDTHLAIQILSEYVLGAIALCLCFTYGLGMDLTLAARFQFFYAPAVILLLSAALAGCWNRVQNLNHHSQRFWLLVNGKVAVSIIWLMAVLGGATANWNLGYLQNQRPDVLASVIQKASQGNVLIATTHLHHGQTGRMMGLAWEFQHQPNQNLQFYLASKDPQTKTYTHALQIFQEKLIEIPRPLDLWLVEFRTQVDLESQNCVPDNQYGKSAGEYSYKLYHCATQKSST